MKWLLIISFLFISSDIFSQNEPQLLSKKLTVGLSTDLEKVAAIFNWITENIDYAVRRTNKNPEKIFFLEEETNGPLKPLNERVAFIVLQKKLAVCDGYARLFKTLCDYAGIRSEIIIGYARANHNKPTPNFGVNHYWNAVYLNDKWNLLDATWASGFISRQGGVFIRKYDDYYFLTKPEDFIKDHYPDDIKWTLLPETRIPDEFRLSPFKQTSFNKYQITSYSPSIGIINTFVGDTITLELKTSLSEGRVISPSLISNPDSLTFSDAVVLLRPDEMSDQAFLMPRHCKYTFNVNSDKIQWLYLIYNDDLVLRYKINVKQRNS